MASVPSAAAGARRPAQPRMFFALWPDADTATRLHALGGEVQARCGGRRMRRETLHLTLAFIGEVAPERLAALRAIGDALAPAPFTLCLDRLGTWRHNRIAWAGAQAVPDALAALVVALADALAGAGFRTERRPFAPHVTLLRRIDAALPASAIEPIEWRAAHIALVRSAREADGACYRMETEWPVRGAG